MPGERVEHRCGDTYAVLPKSTPTLTHHEARHKSDVLAIPVSGAQLAVPRAGAPDSHRSVTKLRALGSRLAITRGHT